MSKQLKELAEAAAQGTWERCCDYIRIGYDPENDENPNEGNIVVSGHSQWAKTTENLDFIAAANPSAVLALIEQLEEARELIARFVPEGVEQSCDECDGDDSECPAYCSVREARAFLAKVPA